MNIGQALSYLYPDANPTSDYRVIDDGDGQKIEHWGIDSPIPTNEDIEAAQQASQKKWEAEEYKILRQKEYPSVGAQLDALYHAGVFPDDMAARIAAVKAKYPKPKGD